MYNIHAYKAVVINNLANENERWSELRATQRRRRRRPTTIPVPRSNS